MWSSRDFVEGMIQDSPEWTIKSNESKVCIHNKNHLRQPIKKQFYIKNMFRIKQELLYTQTTSRRHTRSQ